MKVPMYSLPDFIELDKSSASHDELQEIESILKCKIPEDYREFLKTCNGASIDMPPDYMGAAVHVTWVRYDLTDADRNEVEEFEKVFFIGTIWDAKNVIQEVKQLHVYGDTSITYLPKRYLPISHDNGGCDYIMDVSDGATRGAVYLWPVNINEPWGEGDNTYLGHIADSFTQFLHEKIVEPPEDW